MALLICCSSKQVMAQIGYNYYKFDFGISAAYNRSYTDYINSLPGYSAGGTVTFNETPFINYTGETQLGYIAGKSPDAPNADRSFKNVYALASLRAQLQLGECIDYSGNQFSNFLKNIYASSGIGAIYGRLKISASTQNTRVRKLFIPFKAGYEIKIFNDYNEPRIKVDIGYQYNYILGDNLDGYSNRNSDGFSQISVGLKMGIGPYTSYGRPINY